MFRSSLPRKARHTTARLELVHPLPDRQIIEFRVVLPAPLGGRFDLLFDAFDIHRLFMGLEIMDQGVVLIDRKRKELLVEPALVNEMELVARSFTRKHRGVLHAHPHRDEMHHKPQKMLERLDLRHPPRRVLEKLVIIILFLEKEFVSKVD